MNRLYIYFIFGILEKVWEIGDLWKIKFKLYVEIFCCGYIFDEIWKRVGYFLFV